MILSPSTRQHLENLAARLGLTVEAALDHICQRGDILDHIAAALAVPVPVADVPLRLRPENPVSEEEIATITVSGNNIHTRTPHRHETFVEIVIRLRYKWNGAAWARRIDKFSEPLADRLVELGVHLLAAGFIVEIPSQDIADRIAAGKPFVGTELNPRRLAVLLQKLAQQGAAVEIIKETPCPTEP